MKIAVIGAGAIGSAVGGLLASAGEEVTLIGRPAHVAAVNASGLRIDGALGPLWVAVNARERLDFTPDVALLTVKTQGVTAAAREIQPCVAGVPLVTMQNGVRSDDLVAGVLGRGDILSCVVLMGVTFLEPGRVTYARPGTLVLGVPFGPVDDRAKGIARLLDKAVPTRLTHNIQGAHWTKLIINENNALPAITGLSLQEIGRRSELRRLATLLMQEAAETIEAAGIALASLPQLPAPALRAMLRLPTPIAALLPRLMSRSLGTTPALGSTLQSVKRGERTEIDYLNGEVVALGRTIHRPTPYNEAVVELVHRVEATGTFLTAAQVMAAVKHR
ncbi:MAG: ketopantoate reductase family protein [Candidatus Limnocylindrales bacterium]